MNGMISNTIPIDAASTTALPTLDASPSVSSEKLIALSYPFTENKAVANAAMIALVATGPIPFVPAATWGWVNVLSD
jgi:hypothetical protein